MEDVKKSHNEQTLTEQWKKCELPKGYYYAEDDGEELIIHIQGKNGSVLGDDFDLKATDWIKPIDSVPSYEEWQPFTDPYFRGLTTKDIAELAKKSIRLTKQHCEDATKIFNLKELLKECRYKIIADLDKARLCKSSVDIEDFEYMLNRIDEVLNEHIHSK